MLVNKKLNERVYVCTTVEDAAGVCVMQACHISKERGGVAHASLGHFGRKYIALRDAR